MSSRENIVLGYIRKIFFNIWFEKYFYVKYTNYFQYNDDSF